jgi:C4-dicarboxylate-specific signal transduction histidine kinase
LNPANLFQPFSKTCGVGGGLGLGIFVACRVDEGKGFGVFEGE